MALLGCVLWMQAGIARAAGIRYVATAAHGGNDNGGTNACSNVASPCLTIQNAVNHAVAGETIMIGPGVFPESVTDMTKGLTFTGAGAGSIGAFDPATDTALDAASTPNPGMTLGNGNITLQNLRVRGGLEPDGMGGDVKPAIRSTPSAAGTLTITNSILTQAAPPNPDVKEYAVLASGTKVVVQSSTVAGFEDGIHTSGAGGSLSIDKSAVLTPVPPDPGASAGVRAAVTTLVPALITDSRLTGIAGLADEDTSATVIRSVITASAGGAGLTDTSGGETLALRDSVVDAVGSGSFGTVGVELSSTMTSDPTPPSLTLVGDTVLARGGHGATALAVDNVAASTRVTTRNTILDAIDTSGLEHNADIAAGDQAIAWDIGYTDFTKSIPDGIAPAPGSGTNIDAAPGFIDDSGANLRLAPSSPLFDKGDPSILNTNEKDVTGAPRSVPHVCGGPALPDLGAFEAATPTCTSPMPQPAPTPAIGHFAQSHKKWRDGSKAAALTASKHAKHGKHKKKAPVGTTFSFALNTPATATLTFTRSTSGRKGKGGKCVAETKHNKHKRPCKRTIPAGALTFPSAVPGTNRIAFDGRLSSHKKLRPGKYAVTVQASNSTGHSGTSKLSFTVVK